MKDNHFIKTTHLSQTRKENNSQEVLLADLIGADEAEIMFEESVDRDAGIEYSLGKFRDRTCHGDDVTGGDPDDDWYQAEVVGEEAVGGQTPTPDQSVTEQLLQSMGLASTDGEPIRTKDKLERRDRDRWELEPESSEDYWDRFD